MNIMLYRWDACGEQTLYNNLCAMGHRVAVSRLEMKGYDKDPEFSWKFMIELEKNQCEAVFTMDYFPILSDVCMAKGIKYIAWVFDNPNLTLYSQTVYHDCNHIFLFDREQYRLFSQEYRVPAAYYMPLAVDADYYDGILEGTGRREGDAERYRSDISFVGRLYTNDQFSADIEELTGIPEFYKGYIDGAIDSQLKLYGYHLIPELLREKGIQEEIQKYYDRKMSDNYFAPYNQILSLIIDRKAANIERGRILTAVSQRFPMDIYTDSDTSASPNIRNRGYADYYTQMPKVFKYSRINLNITVRSISSGMNLRTLDILGCGGFLLTNYQPETAEYFEDGREVVMYGSEEELLEKIGYYLDHEEERRQIALNGYRKVREQFSYRKKLQEIFDIVEGRA